MKVLKVLLALLTTLAKPITERDTFWTSRLNRCRMFFIYASPPLECLPSAVVSPSFVAVLSLP